jgi:hypothetical protein
MNAKEFNEKWRDHLEEGHYGLDIDIEEVVEYLDEQFEVIKSETPDFTYSQIKLKFSMARVYLSRNVNRDWPEQLEEKIEEILWLRDFGKERLPD